MHRHRAWFLGSATLPAMLAAQVPFAPLTGAVRDAGGAAVAGATVRALCGPDRDLAADAPLWQPEPRLVASTPTDQRGRFALQLPEGLPCRIEIAHPAHGRFAVEGVVGGELPVVQLLPAATLRGRVVFADDGSPAVARVGVQLADGTELLAARTAADGSFRLAGLPAAEVEVAVLPDAGVPAAPQRLVLDAGDGGGERPFAVARGVRVRGRVVDRATGAPVAGALVGSGWNLQPRTSTDANGRYVLAGHPDLEQPVHCVASGRLRMSRVPAGGGVADFALDTGTAIAGRVTDPAGQPIAGLRVLALSVESSTQTCWHSAVRGTTDRDGRFVVSGVGFEPWPELVLFGDGWPRVLYEVAYREGDPMDQGTIVLQRPRMVRGRVLDQDGEPVAGRVVQLWGVNADRRALTARPLMRDEQLWCHEDGVAVLRRVRTDAQGAFVFGDVPGGEFLFVVPNDRDWRLHHRQEVAVGADPVVDLGRVRVDR